MAEQQDYTGLDWVSGEIDNLLTETRQALEKHLNEPGNTAHLKLCLTTANQIHKTLKALQQSGATLLAEELKELLSAVIRKGVQDLDIAHECLMQAILQLPGYIEQVVNTGVDRPMPLLPLINEMRSLRGADALSKAAFFYPQFIEFPPALDDKQIQKLEQSGIVTLLPKIRQKYQVVLAAYLREQQRGQQLQLMARIFAKLQNLCWDTPLSPLWEASSALVEGLQNQGIKQTLHITNLLRAVDLQLRAFVMKGPSFVNTTPDDSLFRGLLYFIAQSDNVGNFTNALKARYKLDEALAESEDSTFIGSEATIPVIQALNDELAGIKDAFDLYLLATEPDPLILQNQVPIIQQISDTLSMLGLDEQSQQTRQFKQQLHDIIETGHSSQGNDLESSLMAIATGFLKLETVLDQFANGESTDSNQLLDDVFASVIKQTRNNLQQTKDAIADYVDHQFQQSYLLTACDLLRVAYGGLGMTPFTQAADVVHQCADFIAEQWNSNQGYTPDKQELENLADVVTAVEYYLDRLSDPGREHADAILEMAQESLSKLQEQPEIPQPEVLKHKTFQPEAIQTFESEPLGYDLSAFEAGNLELVDIADESPEKQPPARAVFQIDDPIATSQVSEQYSTKTPDRAIEFVHRADAGETQSIEQPEPSLIDNGLLEVFREEASDVHQQLAKLIPQWQPTADEQTPLLNDIRRAFHTLKGSGRMVEANVIGELAWSVENMLNRLIERSASFSRDMPHLVQRVNNMLPELLDDYVNDNQLLTPDVLVCMEMADALANGEHYSAPEHPDDLSEEEDDNVSVQFGEVITEQASSEQLVPERSAESLKELSPEEQLLNVFQTEARSHLETVQAFIDKAQETVQETGSHLQISDDVHRALHTLKGITKMSAFDSLAQLVNRLEGHVIEFRNHQVSADENVIRALQEGSLLVFDALNQLNDHPDELHLDSEGYLSWLDMLHQQLIPQTAPTSQSDEAEVSEMFSLPAQDLEHLLQIDVYLERWQQGIDKGELTLLQNDLDKLGTRSRDYNLQPVAELSDVLSDMCSYLDVYADVLPTPLVLPLGNGFEALLNMLNQVAAQQQPTRPHDVFFELREALEALLKEESETDDLLEGILDVERAPEPNIDLTELPQAISTGIEVEEIELLDLFLDEAFELSEDSHQALENWITDPENNEPVKELQRLLHSLKGGARMSEQADLADLSHSLEGVYELITSQQPSAENIPLGLLQASHDHIDHMLQAIKTNKSVPAALSYIQKLNEWQQKHKQKQGQGQGQEKESITLIEDEPASEILQPENLPDYLARPQESDIQKDADVVELQTDVILETVEQVSTAPDIRVEARLPVTTRLSTPVSGAINQNREMIRVPAELFEQLINLSGESSISRARIEQEVTNIRHTLDEMETTITRVTEQLRRLDIETQTQILSRHEGDKQLPDFNSLEMDPLEMDRYSELTQLSHSLMESATDLIDLRQAILDKNRESESLLLQQSRTQIQLQDKLLQARMVSFARLLPRLKKITSQVSQELQKSVTLNVQNAEGEMDRTMLERILSPLEHLVRNAVSHGIENADDRRATGKPETGQLELVLKRDGADVVLELHDDGDGIDTEAILERALERQLIAPDDTLSDNDLIQLILEPGFSTANSVNQISGRGVGLDVVNTEVRQMGGSMQIESTRGKGCCFRLRLPFTLSMNRALMVQVGEGLYALPLQSIDAVTVIEPNTLLGCFQNKEPLEYGGEQYDVMFLGQLVGNVTPRVQEESCPMVLINRNGHKYALHVDDLIGSRDIITKNLGPQFATLSGVNGATILGDGRVVVIIDPAALIRKYRAERHYVDLQPNSLALTDTAKKILIVDDSVTMRKVTSRLLSRQGFDVETARDGVEAMHKLLERKPDILLLDIEIPKMDGFEVATSVRHDDRLKNLPIIMLTSRTGDKHRQKAASIGINEYLGKPFQEATLLEAIERLTTDVCLEEA